MDKLDVERICPTVTPDLDLRRLRQYSWLTPAGVNVDRSQAGQSTGGGHGPHDRATEADSTSQVGGNSRHVLCKYDHEINWKKFI